MTKPRDAGGEPLRAAGGVVVRTLEPGQTKIAIIHRPKYDDWSFPKGKSERREYDEMTALREVEEETGFRVALDAELPTVRYTVQGGKPKEVRYWLMRPGAGEFRPNNEVDELRWVGFAEAQDALTYKRDRRLVESVRRLLPSGHPVYLVRHAKAGDREAWTEDDALRPLVKAGRRQAEGLVRQMRKRAIERVVSSPYVRCVQTVRPLALSRRVALEVDDALIEGSSDEDLRRLLDEAADRPTVLCSHSEVVERLIDRLESDGVALDGRRGGKKGSVWILERDADGEIVRMRYEPPPG